MDILIKSAKIIDKTSTNHNKTTDVLISDGKIKEIGDISTKKEKTIDAKGMVLSVGWFDMRANFCDPGLEHKEDINSGMAVAAAGGFTGVALLPNTKSVLQTKNDIRYITSHSANGLVDDALVGSEKFPRYLRHLLRETFHFIF